MDYYAVLQVPKEATRDDIKLAFRRIMLSSHPDRARVNFGRAESGTADTDLSKVREAYDFLMDPDKRACFDRWGEVGAFLIQVIEQQQLDTQTNQGNAHQAKNVKVTDQVDALLSWHGIRLHSFLLGIACLLLFLFVVSWGFGVLTAHKPLFLSSAVGIIESLLIALSWRDLVTVAIFTGLFSVFDVWLWAVYQGFNYFFTIMPVVLLIQVIASLLFGMNIVESAGTLLSTVLLCLRWNGISMYIIYPLVFLPFVLSRLFTEKDRNSRLAYLTVYAVVSIYLHSPRPVLAILPCILLIVGFVFCCVIVPVGHYYIIRLIASHLQQQRPRISGYICMTIEE